MKKHRKKRLFGVLLIIGSSCLGIGLILYALNSNLDYFLTPSELKQSEENVVLSSNTRVKLGGMVKKDSFFINENKVNLRLLILKILLKLFMRAYYQIYLKREKVLLSLANTMMEFFMQMKFLPSMMRTICHQTLN